MHGRNIAIERLEDRRLLSVNLAAKEIVDFVSRPISAFADFDGDGDSDVLVGSNLGSRIAWHENVDGTGSFSQPKSISNRISFLNTIQVADIDDDGDMDVLSTTAVGQVAWHENRDGRGNFSNARIIVASNAGDPAEAAFADIDADSDLDIIVSRGDRVVWYQNRDGKGDFGPDSPIGTGESYGAVTAADVDSDGDLDVITTSAQRVAWHENGDGNGGFSSTKTIRLFDMTNFVDVADLDSDGDLDVVATNTEDATTYWFENADGLGDFQTAPAHVITREAVTTQATSIIDLDGDGDLDLLTASDIDNKIAWYENLDRGGNFGQQRVIDNDVFDAQTVDTADVDGDGDQDVLTSNLSGTRGNITWHENNGTGVFDSSHPIDASLQFEDISIDDVNGDGRADIVIPNASADSDEIVWIENLRDDGTFGAITITPTATDNIGALASGDLDGDGDLDLVAGTTTGLTWFSNTDSAGTFSDEQFTVALDENSPATTLETSDLDGDGDLDVLVGSSVGNTVAWFENDGSGIFLPNDPITACEDGLFPIDIDNDGDQDVLTWGDISAWYENTDGQGNFANQNIITPFDAPTIRKIVAEDLDRDGDLDLMVHDLFTLGLFLNTDGFGTYELKEHIAVGDLSSSEFTLGDLDGDGDSDVINVSPITGQIRWYENLDGAGNFGGVKVLISNQDLRHAQFLAIDFDTDGDLDLVTYKGNRVTLYENRPIADSNDDGVFSSGDLVAAFAAGEYEDDVDGNSTFEEGDWNGDGEFDSNDLIFAFQFGDFTNHVRVNEPAVAAVDSLFDSFESSDRHKVRAWPEGWPNKL